MTEEGKPKKLRPDGSGVAPRSRRIIEAIEKVFRHTHQREMTPAERRQFRLPPITDEKQAPDSA